MLEQPPNCQLPDELQAQIIGLVLQNFYELSLQKYSSNVVDKCVLKLGKQHVQYLIENLFSASTETSGENPVHLSTVQLANLILSEYANFVIKNLFNRNKHVKNRAFLDHLHRCLALIQSEISGTSSQSQPSANLLSFQSKLINVGLNIQSTQKLVLKWQNSLSQQRNNLSQKY